MASGIHRITGTLACALFFLTACHSRPAFVAETAYNDAELKFTQGDFQAALLGADHGLSKLTAQDPEQAWRFRLLKSEILIWQGFSSEAIQVLVSVPEADILPRDLAARRQMLLGLAHSNLQQLDVADHEFANAASLNSPEIREVTCELLLGQGKLAALHHDFARSEELFRKAVQIAHSDHESLLEANALGSLGMLQMRQRRYADAVDWLNASLALAESLKAEATTTRTIGNLGWAYLVMGDLDRAADNFSRAEELSHKYNLIADDQTWLMNIGAIQYRRHDFSGAEATYRRSLHLARQLQDRQEIIYGLAGLARIAIDRKQFSLAQKYDQEAFALEAAIGDREGQLHTSLKEAQIAAATGKTEAAARVFEDVAKKSPDNVTLQVEALDNWADLEAQTGHAEHAQELYKSAIAALDKERVSLKRPEFELSYPTNAEDVYDDYIDFLMSSGHQNEAFSAVEMQRARTLVEGLDPKGGFAAVSFSLDKARKVAARNGHVLLSYWLGQKHSYLWVIKAQDVHVAMLPGQDEIRSKVQRYHSRVASSFGTLNFTGNAGEDLYRMLIGPAEQWIPAHADITIVPDGILCAMNFETLVVPSPAPHYWIEDVSLTTASSVVLLNYGQTTRPSRSAKPGKMLLIVGDPKSPQNYPVLTHAREEVNAVTQHFNTNEETLLTGMAATPTAYFSANPQDYALIHFVAHGTASRLSPLDSAVVLSDDGKSHNLYARQIASMNVHARLVTISACDSAGERIYSSEGLVGLSWAFLRAGAHQVISALWEVNDVSTPKLMDRFYSSVAAGQEPAAALRSAKLEMLHSGTIYAKPFYWAPFVLYEGH